MYQLGIYGGILAGENRKEGERTNGDDCYGEYSYEDIRVSEKCYQSCAVNYDELWFFQKAIKDCLPCHKTL
jgi:hypothetical protein